MGVRSIWLWLPGAMALLAGCGSVPPPEGELAAASVAVDEAVEAEAGTHAPAMLQQAQDKLKRAEQLNRDENYVAARRMAEQAAIDAQVAEAEARAEVAAGNLREVQRGVDDLEDAPTDPIVLPQGG